MNADPRALGRFAPRQAWFIAVLLALFAAVSVQYSFKIAAHPSASAIQRWRQQLLSIDDGDDLYPRFSYPNPPIMALLLRPIAELPPNEGALVWFYLKVGMALAAMGMAFRLIETPEQPFPAWAKAITVLLSLRPIMGDLMHGNVNLFILFLVMGALFAFRRGRDLPCGILLGLAIACKVTPALFVPYFLWKRQWKVVAGCAVGLFLFLGPIPGLFLGQEKNLELLRDWADLMIKPFVVSGKVFYSEHNNQSLPGLVTRLLTASPSFSTYVNDIYTPTLYHNVATLSARQADIIVKAFVLLFAGLGIWACRTPTTPRAGWRLPAEFSVVLLGMLLFSERTWKHHCVTLLLPFAVIVYFVAVGRAGPRLRAYLIGTLVAAALLMLATSTGPLGDHLGKMAQVYGAYVWTYLLLIAALVVMLRQPPAEDGAT